MKLQTVLYAIFCILIVCCKSITASELKYDCKVKHVYRISDNGSLIISNFEKDFKDREFTISRLNGEIIGAVVPTLLAKSKKVIHKGDKGYSFKAVAYFENQVQVIEVQEFREGDVKPFVASSFGGAGIVTGICK